MILYRARFVTVAECWYDDSLEGAAPDIVRYCHLPAPLPSIPAEEFVTLWTDLTRSEDQLLAAMSKTTRYEIRKAAADNLRCDSWHLDSGDRIDEFRAFYDAFAASKRLPPADPVRLRIHARAGVLDLSRVAGPDGVPLVWHAHYRDPGHARLGYSASLFRAQADPAFRNLAGRANRFLHWEDFKRFRQAGVRLFDFGGFYPGADDPELAGVNDFKKGFGGEVVKTFFCTRALTARGRLFLRAAAWRDRLRRAHT